MEMWQFFVIFAVGVTADFKASLILSCPLLTGAVIGAQLAVWISDVLFKRTLAVVMILILGLILWNPVQGKNGTTYSVCYCNGNKTSCCPVDEGGFL